MLGGALAIAISSAVAAAGPGAAPAGPPKLLVMPLEHNSAVSDEAALALVDVVSGEVAKTGRYEVMSADDLRRLASFEADQQARLDGTSGTTASLSISVCRASLPDDVAVEVTDASFHASAPLCFAPR